MPDIKVISGHRGTYRLNHSQPEARGRAAAIYRARDAMERDVCVKLYWGHLRDLDESDKLSYQREHEAYQALVHPNILELIDFGIDEAESFFLVLPWCAGGDLRQAMKRRRFFPVTDAAPVLKQVAQAIDFAHSRGFVHGDIKPENILFGLADSHPYLSDFGSADRAAFLEQITAAKSFATTTAYLSPEQIEGGTTTSRSDIYAFGMTAYELLTGRMPTEGRDPTLKQLLAKIHGDLLDAADANPHLPRHAARALMLALDVSPRRRPDTALAFCEMLCGERPIPLAYPKRRSDSVAWYKQATVIAAMVAALGAIVVALINIVPNLVGHGSAKPPATQQQPRP